VPARLRERRSEQQSLNGVLTDTAIHTICGLCVHKSRVIDCEIPRKENSLIVFFFRAPPLPVSPGSPEDDPTIDQTKRPE